MVPRKEVLMLWTLVLYFSVASAAFFIHCDARSPRHSKAYPQHQNPTNRETSSFKNLKSIKPLKHFNIYPNLLADTIKPTLLEAESPFSMPPLDETMGPLSPSYLPQNQPPFCIFPPFTPLPPSVTIPSPVTYATPPPPPSSSTTPISPIENPPPSPLFNPSPPSYSPGPPGSSPSPPEYGINPPIFLPSPPEYVPSPPENVPSPPEYVPSPPEFVPGPPEFGPSPPEYIPSPPESVRPPIFLPPIIYPSPFASPPSRSGNRFALWCVAKPSVPEPIIQEAMNYACGSGAECGSIQPSGSCYEPNTLLAHASYAFNSYWQRTKSNGGTCDFGGTAILVTKDPSYDGCHFMLS